MNKKRRGKERVRKEVREGGKKKRMEIKKRRKEWKERQGEGEKGKKK